MLRNAIEDEILNLLNHHVRTSAKSFFSSASDECRLEPLWRFCVSGWHLLHMPRLAYLWRSRAGTDHSEPPTGGGGPYAGKMAPSRGVRVPWVLKGLVCRCKEGGQQKGVGKWAKKITRKLRVTTKKGRKKIEGKFLPFGGDSFRLAPALWAF